MTTQRRDTGQLQLIEGGRTDAIESPRPTARAAGARAQRARRAEARRRFALDARTRERGREGVAQAKAILAQVGPPDWSESAAS